MRWSVGGILGFVVALALAACANVNVAMNAPEADYAFTVTDSTVNVSWNCIKSQPTVLTVSGIFTNPTSSVPAQDVDITVYGIGTTGRTVSQAKASTKDWLVQTMQSSPFVVTLNLTGTEVRYDLKYEYTMGTGGGGQWGSFNAGDQSNMKMNACPTFQSAGAP
jgi:hypothetical protein